MARFALVFFVFNFKYTYFESRFHTQLLDLQFSSSKHANMYLPTHKHKYGFRLGCSHIVTADINTGSEAS